MAYLTAKQFSQKWKISERRVIKLCKDNRIEGTVKNGMIWLIPENTIKPADKRKKIAQYINTQKRVMIIKDDNVEVKKLNELLQNEGYILDVINEKELEKFTLKEKYYKGLVIFSNNIDIKQKEKVISCFSKTMDEESSIVLVEYKNNISKLERKLSKQLAENIGIRINTLKLEISDEKNKIIDYDYISEDIKDLLIGFKNSTGQIISTDSGYIEFDKNGKSNDLKVGKFYRAINNSFKNLKKGEHLWCASIMLQDEWTEEPLEMNFRVLNMEIANKGVNVERIFIFSKDKIKKFKENKTLKIYMQSSIKTMYVDYDEILEKNPKLLKIVGNGLDGIEKDKLIIDLKENDINRGYISINKRKINEAYDCFQKLKEYSKDLRKILK